MFSWKAERLQTASDSGTSLIGTIAVTASSMETRLLQHRNHSVEVLRQRVSPSGIFTSFCTKGASRRPLAASRNRCRRKVLQKRPLPQRCERSPVIFHNRCSTLVTKDPRKTQPIISRTQVQYAFSTPSPKAAGLKSQSSSKRKCGTAHVASLLAIPLDVFAGLNHTSKRVG